MSGAPGVAVVGAGISGLAAAHRICAERPDVVVSVYETGDRPGGKLRVASLAGVPLDVGAEALLTRRPEGLDLIAAVGLDADRIDPSTTAALVRAGGLLHPMPERTVFGIPGDVVAARRGPLTDAGLARVAAESALPPLPPLVEDMAVGALVRERLGDEVVDRLVDPLLGGVYAGRADELGLRATMPTLAVRLAEGGSLVAAAGAVAAAGRDGDAGPVFTSLVGGLGRLAERLAEAGPFHVHTRTTVRGVRRASAGFVLSLGPVPESREVPVDAVVIATPAAKAARLLSEVAAGAAAELAGIETASLAIVAVALRDVSLPAVSGVLVAANEALTAKALTLSTQKWPVDAGGLTLLRASVGRRGEALALQRDDAELVALVRRDLRSLFGITGEPVDALVTRWGGALPQYAPGHVERVARVRAVVAGVPGLAVCGAAFDGVGIPACIASAHAAADRVLAALPPPGQ
jgi:protoporphyrinogen/coproporphyrinogen III oxidase